MLFIFLKNQRNSLNYSLVREKVEVKMRVFRAKGSYVKKLCGRAFCSFGIKYGVPGIPKMEINQGKIMYCLAKIL